MATHPVFLPVESHGQRSLAGYSPWGHKESDTTERLTHTYSHRVVLEEYRRSQDVTRKHHLCK